MQDIARNVEVFEYEDLKKNKEDQAYLCDLILKTGGLVLSRPDCTLDQFLTLSVQKKYKSLPERQSEYALRMQEQLEELEDLIDKNRDMTESSVGDAGDMQHNSIVGVLGEDYDIKTNDADKLRDLERIMGRTGVTTKEMDYEIMAEIKAIMRDLAKDEGLEPLKITKRG